LKDIAKGCPLRIISTPCTSLSTRSRNRLVLHRETTTSGGRSQIKSESSTSRLGPRILVAKKSNHHVISIERRGSRCDSRSSRRVTRSRACTIVQRCRFIIRIPCISRVVRTRERNNLSNRFCRRSTQCNSCSG